MAFSIATFKIRFSYSSKKVVPLIYISTAYTSSGKIVEIMSQIKSKSLVLPVFLNCVVMETAYLSKISKYKIFIF